MKIAPLLALLLAAILPARAQVAAPELSVKVEADFLELRARGRTNLTDAEAAWQWRILTTADDEATLWTAFPAPAAGADFALAAPLTERGWHGVEVRALKGERVVASALALNPGLRRLELLTPERVAALPDAAQRGAWEAYLSDSAGRARAERRELAAACWRAKVPVSQPAPADGAEFEFASEVPEAWFGSEEAVRLAAVVLSYQTPTGGWGKGVDYAKGAREPGTHWTTQGGEGWHYCGTLDNRSTTEQVKFLARVHTATQRPECRAGVERGVAWLLAAQMPNGGWPQVYPLEPGYHEAVTLNDGAMLHALEVLEAVSRGEAPYAFLPAEVQKQGARAWERGLACLAACQVTVQGRRTVWCAQHDPLTLAPVAARLKEPPSLSGAESAEMLRFLMRKGPLTGAVVTMVESGVAWLEGSKMTGLRKTKTPEGKTDYVRDVAATEVLWARFYDLESGEPVFAGAQDGKLYATFHEMAQHNKVAYDYFTTKPREVLGKELPRWLKRRELAPAAN